MSRLPRIRLAGAVLALAVLALPAPARAQGIADHFGAADPASVEAVALDSVRYSAKIASNNLVGLTLTNYGFIGNNFVTRAPSFEYPLGSNYEHLVRAGIWIGAEAFDDQGAFTGVTTGALDGSQGGGTQSATEFSPANREILMRSALENSADYSRAAVSEEDFIGLFSDQPARSFSPENHRPLNVLVRQENYDWSFSDYAHFNIFHYVIKNTGLPLRNVWVGIYAEMASGTRADYSNWPPSSSSSLTGSWFDKKFIQYDDSLRLFREHYCFGQPIPDGCNLTHVDAWAGFKLLGVKQGADTVSALARMQVTMAVWDYSPGNTLRDQDIERYAIMSAGTVQDSISGDPNDMPDRFKPTSGDPVELLAVGPFAQIDPGDSISVDFAFVGGREVADIQKRSLTAQRAYDLNYVVPVPPPSPRLKLVARDRGVDFYWDDSPERARDLTSPDPLDFEGYRIYLGEDRLNPHLVAQYDLATGAHDSTGFNTGLDSCRLDTPVTIDGVAYQYRYRMDGLRNGFRYFGAATAYDLGTLTIESLESGITQNKTMVVPAPAVGENVIGDKVVVFPNPYRVEARWDVGQRVRDHYLWFTNLPARCALRIYTLSGDLVYETQFDGATYAGEGTRGLYDPNRELDVKAPTLSGTTLAWNLITRGGQAAATGLYLYSVEDQTGKRPRAVGKFLIVKSDREE
ncbi:MAG: hypothetical protein E4H17_00840 [Gemmatimonadales bacterium]|nr:MAG: hypothetical protein E4H17_00840 [Gemmatimonadales bacterium]